MLFLALALVPLAGANCEKHSCSECVAATNLGFGCHWCPYDQSCHNYGSSQQSCLAGDACVSDALVTTCTGSCDKPPTTNIPGFAVPLAQCLIAASDAAYSAANEVPAAMASLGADRDGTAVLSSSSAHTQALVSLVSASNSAILAFRGTELSAANIAQDIYAVRKSYAALFPAHAASALVRDWSVSRGFANAYNSLRDDVIAQVVAAARQLGSLGAAANSSSSSSSSSSTSSSKPVLHVTGHSLGAAMATLAAVDVALSEDVRGLFSAVQVYAFASPRVGNAAFAKGFEARFGAGDAFFVQNYFDQVPHLPPQSLGYRHAERIAEMGPTDGFIGARTPATDAYHFPTAHLVTYYHKVALYTARLAALSGAAVAAPDCAASTTRAGALLQRARGVGGGASAGWWEPKGAARGADWRRVVGGVAGALGVAAVAALLAVRRRRRNAALAQEAASERAVLAAGGVYASI